MQGRVWNVPASWFWQCKILDCWGKKKRLEKEQCHEESGQAFGWQHRDWTQTTQVSAIATELGALLRLFAAGIFLHFPPYFCVFFHAIFDDACGRVSHQCRWWCPNMEIETDWPANTETMQSLRFNLCFWVFVWVLFLLCNRVCQIWIPRAQMKNLQPKRPRSHAKHGNRMAK